MSSKLTLICPTNTALMIANPIPTHVFYSLWKRSTLHRILGGTSPNTLHSSLLGSFASLTMVIDKRSRLPDATMRTLFRGMFQGTHFRSLTDFEMFVDSDEPGSAFVTCSRRRPHCGVFATMFEVYIEVLEILSAFVTSPGYRLLYGSHPNRRRRPLTLLWRTGATITAGSRRFWPS